MSNAVKVQTALRLSQEDQDTIASLKRVRAAYGARVLRSGAWARVAAHGRWLGVRGVDGGSDEGGGRQGSARPRAALPGGLALSLCFGLQEIEKAWKMVDQSHEKEARAKDTIGSLKGEITNLSRLVSPHCGA